MNAIEAMLTRSSVKAYKSNEVPKALVEKIVEAGKHAPTGRNLQSPIILAVTSKQMRDKLSRLNGEILGATESDPFYGAPVVLVVLAKKECRTRVYDGSLVMGNMLLAAHELGLGACWIHRAKETFELPEGRAILEGLGITEEYEGIGNCVVGYPAKAFAVKAKKDNWVYYID